MALRRSWIAALAAILLVAAYLPPTVARAAATRPLTITITKVRCVDGCRNEGLEAAGESAADFYAKIFFNGVERITPRGAEDQELIEPYWAITQQIDESIQNVPIGIQIWDHDSTSGDDLGDSSPRNDDNTLNFTVTYFDGKWRDAAGPVDIQWPQACAIGDGDDDDEPRVEVCFDVSTTPGADADGDGLLDGWERNGYNDNADSVIDVDLPAMGARADHKDIFLELDYVNGRNISKTDVRALKAAFAAAPANAGTSAGTRGGGVSALPNPDGQRGINLHIDMGSLWSTTLREGQAEGTCHDGIDNGTDRRIDGRDASCRSLDGGVEDPGPANCGNNADDDGDGRVDANDPDCMIGDDLGANARGAQIAPTGACELDDAFYAAKRANFDPVRRLIFHYAISDNSDDCPTPEGGKGEVGGNDFVDFNNDGITIMHELGHNLNLDHGGFEDDNCKPNYVSVMNYLTEPGILRKGGGSILDYSPPRVTFDGSDRGSAPLANLVENQLNENIPLDPGDPVNRFVFVDGTGTIAPYDLDGRPDWNTDKADPPYESQVVANIDSVDTDGVLADCANNTSDSTLRGSDDWTFISLPFRQFGDSREAAVRPHDGHELTAAEIEKLWRKLNTTDLAVTVTDAPDPVAAGTELTYTITVTNKGAVPATSAQVIDTLPGDVAFTGGSPSCAASGGVVDCPLGEIGPGGSAQVTIRASVPADLVHANGGPKTLANRVAASNLAGPDSHTADNEASTTTRVVAVADLSVTALQAAAPSQILIGQTLPVTVTGTVANGGPSTPMNATLTTAATAAAGASITPAATTTPVAALAAGTPQTVQKTLTIGCAQPGPHTYTVTGTVTPASADDSDPTPANNQRQTTFTVDCIVPIAINIVPGLNPNLVNLAHGIVPVAALTTRAGEYNLPLAFDATKIKPETVRFGTRNGAAAHGAPPIHNIGVKTLSIERGPLEIVIDLDLDMLMTFTAHDTDLPANATEACLAGSYSPRQGETYRFFGCDAVRMFP
ncbi:hypothetical protein GCM10009555_079360 [Acrocarpospora macrocephala]|uniref:DUF11 domain-containing protein n=1 Tax=Acrocarpospora macrocephala TaxID=150177 RepID=A0A5M3WWX0_9ACTN|nr:DUF11 domain-containing protein [Acrocarpospora macrocephala]GES13967.1 hypothetical protein Amac_075640 [Acrocarpospora macrocephala]